MLDQKTSSLFDELIIWYIHSGSCTDREDVTECIHVNSHKIKWKETTILILLSKETILFYYYLFIVA